MNVIFLTQWYPSADNPVAGIFVREHALAVAGFHQVYVIYVVGLRHELSSFPAITPVLDGPLSTYTLTYPPARIPKTTWINRMKVVDQVFVSLVSKGIHPDIIHANVHNTCDLAYFLHRRYRIPAVLTEHSTEYPRKLLSSRHRLMICLFMNRLHLIMPVSQDLVTHIQAYGVHAPFKVVPNTVNTDIFYPGDTKLSQLDGIKRILVVAGLTKVKGIDYLLRALAVVKKDGGQFHLEIAGDGPDRGKLSSLANDLGIKDEISFLGIRTKSEVANLMRQSDFLALTSRWDNQPVVVLEAMASGLPVLASRVGGFRRSCLPTKVSSQRWLILTISPRS